MTVREMGSVVHPRGAVRRVTALLKAYLDESGSAGDKSGFFVLCGYVSTEETWDEFDDKWAGLLREPCFHPVRIKDREQAEHACRPLEYLHATEMEGLGDGRFRRIGQKNRQRLIRESVHLCCFKNLLGVGSGVVLNEYAKLDEKTRGVIGDPYRLCFQQVIVEIAIQTAKFFTAHKGEKITFIFERNPVYQSLLNEMYNDMLNKGDGERYRMGSLTFAEKHEFRPLQAADRFAFEATKHLLNEKRDRPEWVHLIKKGAHEGSYYHRRGLLALEEKLHVDGLL